MKPEDNLSNAASIRVGDNVRVIEKYVVNDAFTAHMETLKDHTATVTEASEHHVRIQFCDGRSWLANINHIE